MAADVSFGAVGTAGVVAAAQENPSPVYVLLASPTPGRTNSGPRAVGPLIIKWVEWGEGGAARGAFLFHGAH